MLTVETKRHIDSARQILVGKVPDPKAQIDQITNALIYKFMDDMDVQSRDAGGKASFFTGDLEPYAWNKLMAPQKGAQERLNMYTEALEKFSTAASLPQLFRDIFRQAFLPYRDPETLNLFLKEIEYFDYNHSEDLGNAFEYLLSIMGSQGDAGQFRTPRHIIDFIVNIVDPKHNETILDPACGTAGFLISAYKHILEQHDGVDEEGAKNSEVPLTHKQKQKLMENLEGYDISSDMVKLARVNMYLHDCRQPKIYEYDTLTSEERWGDNFDVILANPPFMSPKGGIRPHNKFGVESSRAEVLFVDYIMNHLKQNGRAGIIVPEGVIFQSGKAYKQLRKSLIEDGLMAVVSLPSGVFNPYAGVKTSILIFDNNRSKKSDQLVFAKVARDGFDLGAQRRPIKQNDLPTIAKVLRGYRHGELNTQEQLDEYLESEAALREVGRFNEVIDIKLVDRSKIAETGDYNLSASRYLETVNSENQKWPMLNLGELEKRDEIEFLRGSNLSKKDISPSGAKKCIHYGELYTLYQPIIKNVISKTDINTKTLSARGDVLVPATTTADSMGIAIARSLNEDNVVLGGDINIIRTSNRVVLGDFLSWLINYPLKKQLAGYAKGTNIIHLSNSDIKNLTIPLPPIEVQKEIVAELDSYQKIIDAAKTIAENYKPIIKIDPTWDIKKLDDVTKKITDGSHFSPEITAEGYPYVTVKDVFDQKIHLDSAKRISLKSYDELKRSGCKPSMNDILFSKDGTVGRVARVTTHDEFVVLSSLAILTPSQSIVLPAYLEHILSDSSFTLKALGAMSGMAIRRVVLKDLKQLSIPVPPMDKQKQIVEEMEAAHRAVKDHKKMMIDYEQKIKDKIAEVWVEETTTKHHTR